MGMFKLTVLLEYIDLYAVDFTILGKSITAINNPVGPGSVHRVRFRWLYGIPYWHSVGSVG